MSKVSCNIINDVLPLYVDDVVSEETKTMVEEHLAECADCAEKCRGMRRELEIEEYEKAAEAEKKALLAVKKKIQRKRIVTAVVSGIVISAILFAAVFCMNYFKIPQEYEAGRFEVSIRELDGVDCIFLDYTGKMHGYEQIEYNDGEKLIHYIEIYTTPWMNVFGGDDDHTKHEILLTTIDRSDSTPIDELRYIIGDIRQFYEPTRNYDKLEESSVLLWERDDGLQFRAEPGTGEKYAIIN